MKKFKNGDKVKLLIDHVFITTDKSERTAKYGEYAVVSQVSKITGSLLLTQFQEETNEKLSFWIPGKHVEAA